MSANLKHKLIELFNSYENSLNGESKTQEFLDRKEAINKFEAIGFPTLKHEDWKYTNVAFINKTDFLVNPKLGAIPNSILKEILIPNLEVDLIVMINGNYSDIHSKIISKNIEIKSINSIESNEEKNKFNTIDFDNAFVLINKAFHKDGIFIKTVKNQKSKRPIHILNISKSNDTILTNTRNLIIAEDNSDLKIIYSHYALDNTKCLNINVNEIRCGKNSKVEFNNIQNDTENSSQVNYSDIIQERDSVFTDNTLTINGKFIRNDLKTVLNGENSSSYYNGLYFINKKNHLDNHTFVNHKMPNCTSNEVYKGIIDERGKVVFNGKVLVSKDAQRTNAAQSNKNIVLTDSASINTKPELEIYADDVKCSHGTTTGKLDEEALFYLTQRGIDKDYAKAMLMFTFVYEVIDRLTIDELKKYIEEKIESKLLNKSIK